MTIKLAGKIEAVFCDQCDNPCEKEIIEITHYKDGTEGDAITIHFCSVICQEEHAGVPERIEQEADKRERSAINQLCRFMCPRCTERAKRFQP